MYVTSKSVSDETDAAVSSPDRTDGVDDVAAFYNLIGLDRHLYCRVAKRGPGNENERNGSYLLPS